MPLDKVRSERKESIEGGLQSAFAAVLSVVQAPSYRKRNSAPIINPNFEDKIEKNNNTESKDVISCNEQLVETIHSRNGPTGVNSNNPLMVEQCKPANRNRIKENIFEDTQKTGKYLQDDKLPGLEKSDMFVQVIERQMSMSTDYSDASEGMTTDKSESITSDGSDVFPMTNDDGYNANGFNEALCKNQTCGKKINILNTKLDELQGKKRKNEIDAQKRKHSLVWVKQEMLDVRDNFSRDVNTLQSTCDALSNKLKKQASEMLKLEDENHELSANNKNLATELTKVTAQKEVIDHQKWELIQELKDVTNKYHASQKKLHDANNEMARMKSHKDVHLVSSKCDHLTTETIKQTLENSMSQMREDILGKIADELQLSCVPKHAIGHRRHTCSDIEQVELQNMSNYKPRRASAMVIPEQDITDMTELSLNK